MKRKWSFLILLTCLSIGLAIYCHVILQFVSGFQFTTVDERIFEVLNLYI